MVDREFYEDGVIRTSDLSRAARLVVYAATAGHPISATAPGTPSIPPPPQSPAEPFLRAVIEHLVVSRWPKAQAYDFAHPANSEPILRALGPLEPVDLSKVSVAEQIAAWGTHALPANGSGLLRLANLFGLTGPWGKGRDGVLWDGAWRRPPIKQPVEQFRRDVVRIRDAFLAYEVGYADILRGHRVPLPKSSPQGGWEPAVETAQRKLLSLEAWASRELIGEVVTFGGAALSTVTHGKGGPKVYMHGSLGVPRWYVTRPPSLLELALAQVLALLDEGSTVHRCQNPECGRPFTGQEPRGGRQRKAWTRPELVMYCSQRCGKRAWYLKQHPKRKGK